MITKRHHKAIAEILKKTIANERLRANVAEAFADYLKKDNPSLDRARFHDDCFDAVIEITTPINDRKEWPRPLMDIPCIEMLGDMCMGAIDTLATDGCIVEADGICEHGHPAWPLREGMI